MQIGMVGLGRMGANLVRRLMRNKHQCVVFDVDSSAVTSLAGEGAAGARNLEELVGSLAPPRVVWLMLPVAVVDETVAQLVELMEPGDIVVDGGNSYYRDDLARAKKLSSRRIGYVDCGTSGGVWGLERGYCLMLGGDKDDVARLTPVLESLAPGQASALPTPERTRTDSTAPMGYLHCGPHGAGHFVKMIHNGIEYAMMGALAEGLNILAHARGRDSANGGSGSAGYVIDIAEVAEVWRRGSVISSWLVDLAAAALAKSPDLTEFDGRVADSGAGRWTVQAAIDEGIPAPVITSSLYGRFASRGYDQLANQLLSALRNQFGGHSEPPR